MLFEEYFQGTRRNHFCVTLKLCFYEQKWEKILIFSYHTLARNWMGQRDYILCHFYWFIFFILMALQSIMAIFRDFSFRTHSFAIPKSLLPSPERSRLPLGFLSQPQKHSRCYIRAASFHIAHILTIFNRYHSRTNDRYIRLPPENLFTTYL